MKRLHVHAHVADPAASVAFDSSLSAAPGLDHLGIRSEDEDEPAALKARAQAAPLPADDAARTTCGYARSDKHRVTDPQGIFQEHWRTLGGIPVFSRKAAPGTGCCGLAADAKPASVPVEAASRGC